MQHPRNYSEEWRLFFKRTCHVTLTTFVMLDNNPFPLLAALHTQRISTYQTYPIVYKTDSLFLDQFWIFGSKSTSIHPCHGHLICWSLLLLHGNLTKI